MKFVSSTNKSSARCNARFLSFLCGEVGDFAFLGWHASSVVSCLTTFSTTYEVLLPFSKVKQSKKKDCLTHNNGTDMSSRNIANQRRTMNEVTKPSQGLRACCWQRWWQMKHKVQKIRMDCFDCFAVVILMMYKIIFCQDIFRNSHICKQYFWRNVGWWYTMCWRLETCEDLGWYNQLSCGVSNRFRLMASTYGASRSHSVIPHSLGFLWMSDQTNAVICT